MSVRYDPLVIRQFAREIDARWRGVGVWSVGMDPERNAASIRFADGSALVAYLDRSAGFIVPEEADPLGDEGVRVTRFSRLSLASVEAPADERALMLWLEEGDGTMAAGIAIELHTNRWNLMVLSPGPADSEVRWRVKYALQTRDVAGRRIGPGESYTLPRSERRARDEFPTKSEWSEWYAATAAGPEHDTPERDPLRTAVLETWAWTSVLNVDWILADPARAYDRYREMHALAEVLGSRGSEDPLPAWLTSKRWGRQPYPDPLDDASAEPHADLVSAMAAALAGAGGPSELLEDDPSLAVADEHERLAERLTSRRDREAKRVAALTRQLAAAGSPDTARELGQILLARKDGVERGAESVVLQAFDGSERQIALDPALDAIANAERFFEEARRRERALARLPAEIASAETRLDAFADALERLGRSGPDDESWRLVGGRPDRSKKGGRGGARAESDERLPYIRLRSSGGLEIRVGRGPRDNDDLTFRHSSPEDIWLHASQASGAHVILRWGRRDENPPQRDLVQAAVAAAVNSGARHSGAVAVSWTRRKYVRKPRKSAPGSVVPDRVQTLLVEPDEELVRVLKEAADAV
jgi:hypothetical protein